MFKIGTAQRMMLPYSTSTWPRQPRLTETYFMGRWKDPMKLLGLKSVKERDDYIREVQWGLKAEGFKVSLKELKEWFSEGYLVAVEAANPGSIPDLKPLMASEVAA